MTQPIVDAYELGALLIYATRYAIGRQTYAVSDVCGSIRKHWPRLLERDREVIKRDIRECFLHAPTPVKMADCDAAEWRSVLELP